MDEGQTINLSIGQGYLQVTPLQLAVAYSALDNGGTVVRPHVADAILRATVHPAVQARRQGQALEAAWAIRQGLYMAAHSPAGTSTSLFSDFPVPVAGKTGTAEAGPAAATIRGTLLGPADNPRFVVVVLVAHGGFGAEAAAPIAKKIYAAYLPHLKG